MNEEERVNLDQRVLVSPDPNEPRALHGEGVVTWVVLNGNGVVVQLDRGETVLVATDRVEASAGHIPGSA